MNAVFRFTLLAAVALFAGCSQSPYMRGYNTGQDKGMIDRDVQVSAGVERTWTWDAMGQYECPYTPGTVQYQDFERGYREGYDHALEGRRDPRPPLR